jgi:hypothetical protein
MAATTGRLTCAGRSFISLVTDDAATPSFTAIARRLNPAASLWATRRRARSTDSTVAENWPPNRHVVVTGPQATRSFAGAVQPGQGLLLDFWLPKNRTRGG